MRDRVRWFLKAVRPHRATCAWDGGPGRQWREAQARFLAAVDPRQRHTVAALLPRLPEGSHGLHTWLCLLAWEGAFLPPHIPPEVIGVYLDDPEAVPLYECGTCHLTLPIRPGPPRGGDADRAALVYFPACPSCGGPTDWCPAP